MEEIRNAYRILIVKPKVKRQLGTHGHIWEEHIKIDCK
jgi:hypothetical protein